MKEKELEKILTQSKLLTLEQLRFIAKEILPNIQMYSKYLNRLEQRLRKDVLNKREIYKIRYFDWNDLLDPREVISDDKIASLPLEQKIKRYLHAEARVEFSYRFEEILRKFLDGEISYDEYEKLKNKIARETYGELRITKN